jgi:hypothetical protein
MSIIVLCWFLVISELVFLDLQAAKINNENKAMLIFFWLWSDTE